MVEQEAVNFEVAGSSPVPGSIQDERRHLGVFSCPITGQGLAKEDFEEAKGDGEHDEPCGEDAR